MYISHTSTNPGCPLLAPLTLLNPGSFAPTEGKSTNLGEQIGTGFQVSPGFGIPTGAHDLLIQTKKLETVSTGPKKRPRKVIFTLVGFLTSFAALITLLAYIFAEIQQPRFVNRGLVMQNALLIPPLLEPQVVGKDKVFVLSTEEGETVFFEGKPTKTAGYNGTYLGPTLRAHKGDNLRIVLTNNLSQPITTHWHGMHLPAKMDGGPHQEIAPGETWEPHWTIENEAATLEKDPRAATQQVHEVERVARQALREVREAVSGYRQRTLRGELDRAHQILEAAGIECAIENEPQLLPPSTDVVLAWVVREGVTNVIRHSRAQRCLIRISGKDGYVRVDITNDGGPRKHTSTIEWGSGLSGLAERVASEGGQLEAGTLPLSEGLGFRLRVEIPTRSNSTMEVG